MMRFLQRRLDVLESMDPNRIYVENVRSFLGVRTAVAAWLCGKACRDGFLERHISFEHPELGHSIFDCVAGEDCDESQVVHDETSEALGYKRDYKLSELRKVEYFTRA
jgi:hypothetical protein